MLERLLIQLEIWQCILKWKAHLIGIDSEVLWHHKAFFANDWRTDGESHEGLGGDASGLWLLWRTAAHGAVVRGAPSCRQVKTLTRLCGSPGDALRLALGGGETGRNC